MEARHIADHGRGAAVRRDRLVAVAAVAVAAALALSAGGCGDDGDGKGGGSGDVPDDAVAVVGDREVSEEDLDRQAEALERAQRGGAGDIGREQLEQRALAALLQAEWLEQEAEKRGIEVDIADVRKRWRRAAAAQFDTKKALRQFLGRQTEADVLRQLRLQELTERIHEQVRAEAEGNPEKAVKRFQRDFMERVRRSTACREGYTVPGCD